MPGLSVVIANCTDCHSEHWVQQNRATRAGWHEIIRWIQAKQGRWCLEAQAEWKTLDYLAAEYGPANDSEDGRELSHHLNAVWCDPSAKHRR